MLTIPPDHRRVLFVLPDAAQGGGHLMNFRLADQLTKRKWTADIVFLFDRNRYATYNSEFPQLTLIRMRADSRLKRLMLPLRLARISRKYDVVIAGLDLAATNYGYLAAKIARKPFISWVHTAFDEHSRSVSRLSRNLSLLIYKRITNVVFPSLGAYHSLRKALGEKLPPQGWQVIKNFYDINLFDKAVAPPPPSHPFSRPVVLSIGRLSKQKAYDRLIRIHVSLGMRGIDQHLVILGEGPERANLEALTKRLGVVNSVFLPGHQINIKDWLAGATVFALCSLYEGLPLVLIEALQAGVAIAAMDCPAGPRDILGDSKAGILTPANDESALEDAIARLLEDARLRAKYTERAKIEAQSYAPGLIIPQWEALLSHLVEPFHHNAR